MTSISYLVKDDVEPLKVSAQVDSFGNSPVNHALVTVAQEIAGLLQHTYPTQSNGSNQTKTVSIRALDPKFRQIISIELLTERELEVLQLIVDGHRNMAIARKLYIAEGTVKTHVRNILRKLCVSDRTQAAIRALRCGLVC